MTAGYSGTPLAKKLGIKQGFVVKLINQPEYYFDLFTDMPEIQLQKKAKEYNMIHFFCTKEKELVKQLPKLKEEITQNGMIWVSWPKKAAKTDTDITENIIRDIALATGLVDVKVCAIDDKWSGLKLVIRLQDRQKS